MIDWICDECGKKYFSTNNPSVYKHPGYSMKFQDEDGVEARVTIDWGNIKKQLCPSCELLRYKKLINKMEFDIDQSRL